MAFVSRITVRFADVDYARVVYYPRYFDYCHRVFEDFFVQEVGMPYAQVLGELKVGFPTVHAEADFKAPLRFGEEVRVELDVVKLSLRSMTCRYRFFGAQGDELRAAIEVVVAAVSMETFASVPLPEEVRVAFLNHLVGLSV